MTDFLVIEFADRLERDTVEEVLSRLQAAVSKGKSPVVLDLTEVESFDSAGMGAIVEGLRQARERGVEVRLKGMSAAMLDFFSLVSVDRLTAVPKDGGNKVDLVSRVGGAVEPFLQTLQAVLQLSFSTLQGIFFSPFEGRQKRLRLDRTAVELEATTLGALPIVCLIGFLLGLILAMQAYVQLRAWGAELYMADMVGVSVIYEIGPLMTGIILAARSGSSNAAQLGSMVVSEEIDALRQMGINQLRFLVIPKVLALAFAVLALGLVFDLVAMVGGALFAYGAADIEPWVYKVQTQQALRFSSFLIASAKCVAFGGIIGVVGCALGLKVQGGSEGVGRATTNSVVLSIFLIIVVDAIFVAVQQMWPG